MAKETIRKDNYSVDSWDVIVTVFSGDGNHSDITIKLDGDILVIDDNIIKDYKIVLFLKDVYMLLNHFLRILHKHSY